MHNANPTKSLADTLDDARAYVARCDHDRLSLVIASCRADACASACPETIARIAIWRGIAEVERDRRPRPRRTIATAEDMFYT